MRPVLNHLRLPASYGTVQMLALEEALLRHDSSRANWLVTADGPAEPTIVLGLSGKPEKLIDIARCLGDCSDFSSGAQVVRRFTGGGTVVLGPGTCLCSFIMRGWPAGNAAGMSYHHIRATSSTTATPYQPSQSSSSLSSSSSSGVLAIDPKAVMAWSEDVYRPALEYLVGEAKATELFRCRENDYVLGDMKFGGNAQAITRGDFVHHTSFLWALDPALLSLLTVPEKQPEYRLNRGHDEFLTTLQAQHFAFREETPPSTASSASEDTHATNFTAPFWTAVDIAVAKSFQVNEVSLLEVAKTLDISLKEIGLDGLDGWTYSRARGAPPDTAPTPGAAAVEAGAVSAAAVAAAAGAVTTPLTSKKGPRGARTKVVESDVLRTVHLPLQTNLTR